MIPCLFLAALWSQVSVAQAASGGKVADTHGIAIDGAVQHPRSLTLVALEREPATTEAVSLKTHKGAMTGKYTGVLLWTLLQQAVIKLTPGVKNDILRHTIMVAGRDGYEVALSVAEIDPKFGGDRAMIAYAMDGEALPHGRGSARLIVPTDKAAGRAVFDVASITVR
jgi:DMSO/TMAO reductase YedYZ molybdopterin-dependent catalytic subunit